MPTPDQLELFINCQPEQMDELLTVMKSLTKCPWMFWDTHYTASFSPPEPSFDFARFEIDDPKAFAEKSGSSAKFQGQIRWCKQKDFNVLLVWETSAGAQELEQPANDCLVQDFYDLIVKPACEQLNLIATIGPGAWQKKTNMNTNVSG